MKRYSAIFSRKKKITYSFEEVKLDSNIKEIKERQEKNWRNFKIPLENFFTVYKDTRQAVSYCTCKFSHTRKRFIIDAVDMQHYMFLFWNKVLEKHTSHIIFGIYVSEVTVVNRNIEERKKWEALEWREKAEGVG